VVVMANRLYFPLQNCDAVYITMTYGEPYPKDRNIKGIYYQYLKTLLSNKVLLNPNFLPLVRKITGNSSLTLNTPQERFIAIKQFFRTDIPASLSSSDKNLYISFRNRINTDSAYMPISSHHGVDLAYAGNTGNIPVFSIAPGKVEVTKRNWCSSTNCGGYIVIRHNFRNNTFWALYGHVNPQVSAGVNVKENQLIALTSTGMEFNPHLHLEISVSGLQSFTNKYPGYPYNQYYLNLALLGIYIYDPNSSTYGLTNPLYVNANFYGNLLTTKPYIPTNSPMESSMGLNYPWNQYYGIIDPIKFLSRLCDIYDPNGLLDGDTGSTKCQSVERREPSSFKFSLLP
jgi:murein DD-endopeptidase MepM/ murein hydrolase activator NlpD